MDGSAKVRSLDTIERFKTGLIEFGDLGQRALSEAESDIQRTIWWLKNDQNYHWRTQKKKRSEKLAQAKSELFRAQLSADQDNRSTTTERRAVEKAEKAVEEAEWKLQRISHWVKLLEREAIIYKGQAQQMANALAADVPTAAAKLENMARILEEYVHMAPPTTKATGGSSGDDEESASRGGVDHRSLPKIRDLRDAAPRQSRRDSAESDVLPARPPGNHPDPIDLTGYEIRGMAAPEPESRVVIETAALTSSRVFLERSQSVIPKDSGWYLGAVGRAGDVALDPSFRAMRVDDLLDQRPELASLLALPRGYAVVVEGRRIEEIWNDRSRKCERRASAATSSQSGQQEGS